jgi:hypothetical protein
MSRFHWTSPSDCGGNAACDKSRGNCPEVLAEFGEISGKVGAHLDDHKSEIRVRRVPVRSMAVSNDALTSCIKELRQTLGDEFAAGTVDGLAFMCLMQLYADDCCKKRM